MSRLNQTKARNQLARDWTPPRCSVCDRPQSEHTSGDLLACMGKQIQRAAQSFRAGP